MSLTKTESEIMEYLKSIDVAISINELSENLKKDLGNMSRYIKNLDKKQEITIKMVKDGKRHMKYVQVNDGKERDISNEKLTDNAEIVPKKPEKTIKIEKTNEKIPKIDISQLKDEILDELKKSLANFNLIQKTKSEIIKFMNKIPIREVDKKELGYEGLTSNEVRSLMIDLLDNLIIFRS